MLIATWCLILFVVLTVISAAVFAAAARRFTRIYSEFQLMRRVGCLHSNGEEKFYSEVFPAACRCMWTGLVLAVLLSVTLACAYCYLLACYPPIF